jgi:hypothetical protein
MILRNRPFAASILMRVGWVSLLVAQLSTWLLHRPSAGVVPVWADGVCGFFFGVGIASLLLSIRWNRRSGPAADGGVCGSR